MEALLVSLSQLKYYTFKSLVCYFQFGFHKPYNFQHLRPKQKSYELEIIGFVSFIQNIIYSELRLDVTIEKIIHSQQFVVSDFFYLQIQKIR